MRVEKHAPRGAQLGVSPDDFRGCARVIGRNERSPERGCAARHLTQPIEHGLGRGDARFGLLGQERQDETFELLRDTSMARQRSRSRRQVLGDDGARVPPAKGRMPGEQLVEERAERIEIGAPIE